MSVNTIISWDTDVRSTAIDHEIQCQLVVDQDGYRERSALNLQRYSRVLSFEHYCRFIRAYFGGVAACAFFSLPRYEKIRTSITDD